MIINGVKLQKDIMELYLVEFNGDSGLGEEITSKKKKKNHSVFFHQSENTLKDKPFKNGFPLIDHLH